MTPDTVLDRANALFKDRERFEGAELARSNKALYKLLTQVYELFEAARADVKCLKAAVKTMSEKLKERGVKIQSNLLCFSTAEFSSAEPDGCPGRTRFLVCGYDRVAPATHMDQAVMMLVVPPWR